MWQLGQNATFKSKKYSFINWSRKRKALAIGILPNEINGSIGAWQIKHGFILNVVDILKLNIVRNSTFLKNRTSDSLILA